MFFGKTAPPKRVVGGMLKTKVGHWGLSFRGFILYCPKVALPPIGPKSAQYEH
jgi:hypothetical protein